MRCLPPLLLIAGAILLVLAPAVLAGGVPDAPPKRVYWLRNIGTDSMAPMISPSAPTIYYTPSVPFKDVKINDTIVYKITPEAWRDAQRRGAKQLDDWRRIADNGEVRIVHRVVNKTTAGGLIVKGINRQENDPFIVTPREYRGIFLKAD